MKSVVTFGEILLRLAAPGYTRLLQKDSFDASFCGGEANVAVSLSNFGINSKFITKLPNNDIGLAAARTLKYFGVDVSDIVYDQMGRMGLYYLEKGASQRPSQIIYDRSNSSIALAKKDEFNWNEILDNAEWFHWTGINPALSDDMVIMCEEACKAAHEKGIIVSCDLNYRSSLWSTEKARHIMTKLMKYVDVCIGNEEDAEKVLGIRAENTDINAGKLEYSDYERIAGKVCDEFGCKYVAFTLRESISASLNGWSGMLYDGRNKESFFSNKYDIQIVDRVGGGDSFTAGLIYSLMKQMPGQEAIDFAIAASCLKQCMEGDFNRSTLHEVQALMNNGGNGRVQR